MHASRNSIAGGVRRRNPLPFSRPGETLILPYKMIRRLSPNSQKTLCAIYGPLRYVSLLRPVFIPSSSPSSSSFQSKYHPSSDFLGNIQEHINEKMRGILVDWLVQVHYKFNLLSETLFLATNFMDRFLEKIPVSRSKLQLVGMVALLVACKYEEIYLPEVNDFVYICDHAYTKDEILQMEGVMLNTLQFSLTVATPAYFLARFCKAADCSSKVKMYATYVCELCLQEYSMRTYRPSTLCAAALYTALLVNNSKDEVNWNATLQHYTNYTDAELHACVQDMKTLLKKGPTYPSLTAVRRKYASSRYEAVATIELPF
eukprot:TRINITY_DN1226_c1_g1_i1.p1 TRINITY_DN1226_c1_g1~~TRINITY_DN1226_c1_g1_i1.p1  ORF type:complete len:316 (-),score=56.51 TRINITY_DN1226_c1_g1_i1:463-1410(-)